MKNNIRFNYMYRDAGNYKNHGSVIFSNPENVSLAEIETAIKSRLIDGEWFYHDQFGVPSLFFSDLNPLEDPSWHEFVGVELTDEKANSEKTITELISVISVLKPASFM